jgi:hypothetical protein
MAGRVSWLEKVLKPDPEKIAASIRMLEKFVTPEADRAERRVVDQFAAYRWNGSALAHDLVRDISSSGLYLLTAERWQPGAILALTLQREGPLDLDPSRRITTQAKVIRCGPDGVGLAFLWSKNDPKSRQWDTLLESLIGQTRPADMLSLARMVEAFAFLGRICPEGVDEIGEWIRTRASSHKILNAVSLALKAEDLLGIGAVIGALRVNPAIAVRILELGSGTDEEWLHRYWAGLLVTSLSTMGRDKSNLDFIELLSQLTTIPLRIFTVVCTKAAKVVSESGDVSARPLACNLDELASTVSARKPQMERELESLSGFKLIQRERSGNHPALLASSETSITPTNLALQLFALCNGHRGDLREFYFADPAADASSFKPQSSPVG